MTDATITGEGFCDAVLPAMLADLGASCARVSGVVQLYVKGDVDLARVVTLDAAPGVRPGEDPEADVIVAVHESALTEVLMGTLDVQRALEEGLVEVEGDVDVLARFAAVLSGGASPLSTRLAAMSPRGGA